MKLYARYHRPGTCLRRSWCPVYAVSLLSFLLLGACSPISPAPENGLVYRLKNRGPVPLSSDNPFLAANLLISKEMEKSPEIAGFVSHRGAPAALEVEKGYFHPLVLHFYYPENREQFTFEQVQDGWFIRGPLTIDSNTFTAVSQLTRTLTGEPKLEFSYMTPREEVSLPGKEYSSNEYDSDQYLKTFETDQRATAGKDETAPPINPNRYPITEPEPAPRAAVSFRSPGRQQFRKPDSSAELLKELVLRTSSTDAELTPKGDLVHYITYPGETLSMVARWYTGDRANAGRLARMNRLRRPDHLEIGDVIIIPSYLIQNTKRLTEKAVKELEIIAAQEKGW